MLSVSGSREPIYFAAGGEGPSEALGGEAKKAQAGDMVERVKDGERHTQRQRKERQVHREHERGTDEDKRDTERWELDAHRDRA